MTTKSFVGIVALMVIVLSAVAGVTAYLGDGAPTTDDVAGEYRESTVNVGRSANATATAATVSDGATQPPARALSAARTSAESGGGTPNLSRVRPRTQLLTERAQATHASQVPPSTKATAQVAAAVTPVAGATPVAHDADGAPVTLDEDAPPMVEPAAADAPGILTGPATEIPEPGSASGIAPELFLAPRNFIDGVVPDGCKAALEGVRAFYAKDYATAYGILTPRAMDGDACAQYYVARRYDTGRDVPQDMEEAAYWYRKSADQGFARAQYNLAEFIHGGDMRGTDLGEPARLWYAAARRGHGPAMIELGAAFECGCGVTPDIDEAADWYSLAVFQGYPEGLLLLEQLLEKVDGKQSVAPKL